MEVISIYDQACLFQKISTCSVATRHLGFQVVALYMVPSSVPLEVYANSAGSFIIAFDNDK